MHTLELRESRSSLAGVLMAIAAEGVGVVELRGLLGTGLHGPARAATLKALHGGGTGSPAADVARLDRGLHPRGAAGHLEGALTRPGTGGAAGPASPDAGQGGAGGHGTAASGGGSAGPSVSGSSGPSVSGSSGPSVSGSSGPSVSGSSGPRCRVWGVGVGLGPCRSRRRWSGRCRRAGSRWRGWRRRGGRRWRCHGRGGCVVRAGGLDIAALEPATVVAPRGSVAVCQRRCGSAPGVGAPERGDASHDRGGADGVRGGTGARSGDRHRLG